MHGGIILCQGHTLAILYAPSAWSQINDLSEPLFPTKFSDSSMQQTDRSPPSAAQFLSHQTQQKQARLACRRQTHDHCSPYGRLLVGDINWWLIARRLPTESARAFVCGQSNAETWSRGCCQLSQQRQRAWYTVGLGIPHCVCVWLLQYGQTAVYTQRTRDNGREIDSVKLRWNFIVKPWSQTRSP